MPRRKKVKPDTQLPNGACVNKLIKPIIVQRRYTLVMPLPCVARPATFASIVHDIVVAVVAVSTSRAREFVCFAAIGVATFTRCNAGLFKDCSLTAARP